MTKRGNMYSGTARAITARTRSASIFCGVTKSAIPAPFPSGPLGPLTVAATEDTPGTPRAWTSTSRRSTRWPRILTMKSRRPRNTRFPSPRKNPKSPVRNAREPSSSVTKAFAVRSGSLRYPTARFAPATTISPTSPTSVGAIVVGFTTATVVFMIGFPMGTSGPLPPSPAVPSLPPRTSRCWRERIGKWHTSAATSVEPYVLINTASGSNVARAKRRARSLGSASPDTTQVRTSGTARPSSLPVSWSIASRSDGTSTIRVTRCRAISSSICSGFTRAFEEAVTRGTPALKAPKTSHA
mmetsp:Transcript_4990/g.12009  ORF Transcript_4990/g.12009 Transcript_4990/m.12009 type:complete len:298 (-) Transcript_4990:800-1693(-)